MIAYRTRGLTILHYILQCIVGIAVFWLWLFILMFGIRDAGGLQYDRYVIYSLLVSTAFGVNLFRSSVNRTDLLELSLLKNVKLSSSQTFTIIGALLVFVFAARDETMSRVFLFSLVPVLYIYLFLSNKYFPRLLAPFIFHRQRRHKTLLLGASRDCWKLDDWLRRKATCGLDTVGLLTDEEGSFDTHGVPVLGGSADLERILKATRAAQLIVLGLSKSFDQIASLSDICDRLGVRLMILNDLEESLNRSVSFVHDEGFSFLSFRLEPLECPVNRILKRAVDISLALPVILFLLPPVSLVVWLFQRAQAPGPIFFRQRRSGIRGSIFEIYKFRTMVAGTRDEFEQATEKDPRVFPAGRWLRKLSIDELPQFLNVLTGEMSIVGPRPHIMRHDVAFGQISRYYQVRSFIKPGITGLAQVRGLRGEARRNEELLDRIQSDLYYLENWSIVLDWIIILKTAYQVLVPPRTAY